MGERIGSTPDRKRGNQGTARVAGAAALALGALAIPVVARAESQGQNPPQGIVSPAPENPPQINVGDKTMVMNPDGTFTVVEGAGVMTDTQPANPNSAENPAPLQRVINNLNSLTEEGLDPKEVAEYSTNPDQTVFNTFRIWSEPNGNPRLVIVTGERPERAPVQGLTKPENVINLIAGLDRLYSIDPTIFDTLDEYGLIAVVGNTPTLTKSGYSSTFGKGRIYLNEINTPDPAGDPGADLEKMYVILDESRHMAALSGLVPTLLDPNLGIDKALWANEFLDAHLNAFTSGEQRVWRSLSRQVISYYTNIRPIS